MSEPVKRIPVYVSNSGDFGIINLMEKIARLRAKHWGYEDIAVELGVDWRHIRPFVITKKGGK